jgi:hypothetical protein
MNISSFTAFQFRFNALFLAACFYAQPIISYEDVILYLRRFDSLPLSQEHNWGMK